MGTSEPQEPAPARAKKILIVEDDADTRMGLIVRLRKAGYETAFAGDASTALTVALKEKLDLVLLDLGLPGATASWFYNASRTPSGQFPFMVLSARDPEANRARVLEAGANADVHKCRHARTPRRDSDAVDRR